MERIQRRLDRESDALESLVDRLERTLVRRIDQERQRVDALETKRALLDPQRVLERGYAVVRAEGSVVRSAGDVHEGDEVDVTVADGQFAAEVLEDDESQSDGH